MGDYSMANRNIAYTLRRGRAYIFDISSTIGYMGAKYFQDFGHISFDMSSASGYVGEKYVQQFGPRFSVSCRWNLHYLKPVAICCWFELSLLTSASNFIP